MAFRFQYVREAVTDGGGIKPRDSEKVVISARNHAHLRCVSNRISIINLWYLIVEYWLFVKQIYTSHRLRFRLRLRVRIKSSARITHLNIIWFWSISPSKTMIIRYYRFVMIIELIALLKYLHRSIDSNLNWRVSVQEWGKWNQRKSTLVSRPKLSFLI